MKVAVDHLTIIAGDSASVVQFEQRFSTGAYQDVGDKRLVLVQEAGAWMVQSEAMLRSLIESQRGELAAPRDRFSWVVEGDVQLTSNPKWNWGHGAAQRSGEVLTRPVRPEDLPDSLRSWLGRKVRLFDRSKQLCLATVNGFQLVARAQIDGKKEQELTALSRRAEAEEFWELANGSGRSLVATLDQPCQDAWWARDASLPVPEIGEATKPAPAIAKIAKAALRRTSECKAAPGPETTRDCRKDSIVVTVLQGRELGQPVTFISTTIEADRTGDVNGNALWALWKLTGMPEHPLLTKVTVAGLSVLPESAVDLDGDGQSEFLFANGGGIDPDLNEAVMRKQGATWELSEQLLYPFIGCPY